MPINLVSLTQYQASQFSKLRLTHRLTSGKKWPLVVNSNLTQIRSSSSSLIARVSRDKMTMAHRALEKTKRVPTTTTTTTITPLVTVVPNWRRIWSRVASTLATTPRKIWPRSLRLPRRWIAAWRWLEVWSEDARFKVSLNTVRKLLNALTSSKTPWKTATRQRTRKSSCVIRSRHFKLV